MAYPLFLIVYVALYFQGPGATAAIIAAWVLNARERAAGNAAQSDEEDLNASRYRSWQTIYIVGLILTSVAVLLDWISIVADYLQRYPAATDPSVVHTTETITKTIPFVSGLAFIVTAFGRGRGKGLTLATSFMLMIASAVMIVLEACRHTSF